MANSMTGYGCGTASNADWSVTVEMKAVNHRFLEIYCRLPKTLTSVEDDLKKIIQTGVSRGKLDVFVTLERLGAKKIAVIIDNDLAMAYHKSLIELASICHVQERISLMQIASFPGVLTTQTEEEDVNQLFALAADATRQAVEALCVMRHREGEVLRADLQARLVLIDNIVANIGSFSATVVSEQKKRLENRLNDILNNIEIDENRLANELAFFADKSDITEELTRLTSHIGQFDQCLKATECVGRKLDFILQEMLREINTIGSKSGSLSISNLVIEAKSELEKIREQIQNIE